MTLLEDGEPEAAVAENVGADSPFLLVCDHAGRRIPHRLDNLGLPPAALEQHIAWDIGALDLSRRLGEAFGACLIHQTYSRLVIDCNRPPDHPQSIVTVADGWTVPGNLGLAPAEAEARRKAVFDPYHARIAAELDSRRARGIPTLLVCVHSFTPSMAGFERPWRVGVLHMHDSPASFALLESLGREEGLVVGDNEPYAMDGTDYTAPVHRAGRGIDAVELEVRQDLLQDPASARRIADLFIRLLPTVVT
ncbi:MAG: N-formylglutamate amidohydrolase [Caulobacteraceae bacterium]|jgi:predicted N-formylglutamate amidohydrolase|nr:N-formylglutamate amidohydrolase [Caulobacteraceae bacterium]